MKHGRSHPAKGASCVKRWTASWSNQRQPNRQRRVTAHTNVRMHGSMLIVTNTWASGLSSRVTALSPTAQILERCISQRETRSEEHTSELQSRSDLVCRLLLEKKKKEKSN